MNGHTNALYMVVWAARLRMWAALFRTPSCWRAWVATGRRWSLKVSLASAFIPRKVALVVWGTKQELGEI